MATVLPSTGEISLSEAGTELGRATIKIDGVDRLSKQISLNDGDLRRLAGILFGEIGMNNLYGKDWPDAPVITVFDKPGEYYYDVENYISLSIVLTAGGGGGAGGYSNEGFAYGYNGGNGTSGGLSSFGNYAIAEGGQAGTYTGPSTDGIGREGKSGGFSPTFASGGRNGGGGAGGKGGFGVGGPAGAKGGSGGSISMTWFLSGDLQEGFSQDEFVNNAYVSLLMRQLDTEGFNFWTGLINQGASRIDTIRSFLLTSEYNTLYSTNAAFVKSLYVNLLFRYPDSLGYNFWLDAINANPDMRGVMIDSFLASPEFNNFNDGRAKNYITFGITPRMSATQFVNSLYLRLNRRDSDGAGLGFWVGVVESGTPRVDVMKQFLNSTEYNDLYKSNSEFVESLYVNLLLRHADPGGLDFYVGVLNNGSTRLSVIEAFLESAEFNSSRKRSFNLGLDEANNIPNKGDRIKIIVGAGGKGGLGHNDAGAVAGNGEDGVNGSCIITRFGI